MKMGELSLVLCFAFIPCIMAGVTSRVVSEVPTDDPEVVEADLQSFNDFIKKYNKAYADETEYKNRFDIFRQNMNEMKRLRETEQGTARYGITKFSDLTKEELKRYLGYKASETKYELPTADIPDIELPDNFDWRNHNAVTPVKDQGNCGSCWAFSATGNIEGQWALKKGELLSLSEQELLDCDHADYGCTGGDMVMAFQAIIDIGGIETEDEYPYIAQSHGICSFDKSKVKARISSAVEISNSETEMAKWLVQNGPIAVGINAYSMMKYNGGIAHPTKEECIPELNHGVLIVGFGVEKYDDGTIPYWIIKNSWGEDWGENGYYRLYRGDGSCGINLAASSSVVE